MIRPIHLGVILAGVLVHAACGGSAPADPGAAAPVGASGVPASSPQPTEPRPLPSAMSSLALPPDALPPFEYACIRYVPTDGLIEGTAAHLTLQATAPTRFEVPLDAEVRLHFANGARITAPLPSLGAAQVETIQLAGNVPAGTTWEGAHLSITEAGREPFGIRFGEGTPQLADALEAADASAESVTRYGDRVAWEFVAASFASDGPRRGGFYGRAPDGQRFLRTRIVATNRSGRYGVSIGEEAFQLMTELGAAPIALGVNAQAIPLGQRAEFEVIFLVPARATQFTLTVGADGRTPGQIVLRRPAAGTGHHRPGSPS